MQKIRHNYNHTIYASYIGIITQAIVNNFVPLLFLTFQNQFQISLNKISLLVTFNFGVQLLTDLVASKIGDKVGYKRLIVIAQIMSGMGLVLLAILPNIMTNSYVGILIAITVYAVGGGLIEVLVSPIVEACPTEKKEAAMSILHSFYCWGHVFVVVISTIFFVVFGIKNWMYLAIFWAIIPLLNAVYYAMVPIKQLVEDGSGYGIRKLLQLKTFWILLVLMICAGACEQAVSQWASDRKSVV